MNSATSISRRFSVLVIAGLLALAGAVAYVKSMLAHTGGIPSPPLDDTYIYLQYARRWATGHFLSYCDGAAPSTGASSYLHLALMVPGWWAGFHGASYVWYAVGLGALYLSAVLAAGSRLAATLVSKTPGATAASTAFDGWWAPAAFLILIVLNGHFMWASFTGMDTVLFAAGLVLILAGVALRGAGPGWTWILAGCLSFFRPEGIPVGLLGLAVMYAGALRDSSETADQPASRHGRTTAPGAIRRLAFAGAAIFLLFMPALINWGMTGSPVWDSMRVKSLLGETRPEVLRQTVGRLPEAWRNITFLYVSDFHSGSWSMPASWGLEILMGAGLVLGTISSLSGRRGAAGVLAVAWLVAGILMGGFSPADSHYNRYQIPYLPIAGILTICGWDTLARLVPGRGRRLTQCAVVLAAGLLVWPGAVMMKNLYGRNCANILEQQTRVGRWIEANTLPVARVALNDAGAIGYYGNRRIVDLVGLTTHGFAVANRQGAGALFEKLEAMPESERPDILAIYPRWYPYLVATSFVGPSIFSVDLRDNTICGDRLKQVYRINWSMAGTGARPVQRGSLIRDFGISLVDEVDVGDLDSEAAHGYLWGSIFRDRLREFPTGAAAGPGFAGNVGPGAAATAGPAAASATGPVVEDGGRWVSASERMRVRARPGQWLIVVMRTETERPFQVDVSVGGRPAGRLSAEPHPQLWTELVLQVPDTLVTDSLLTVDFRWVNEVHSDGYNSYHYWFLQP